MQHKKKIFTLIIAVLTAITAHFTGMLEDVEAAGHREEIILMGDEQYTLQVNLMEFVTGDACLTARYLVGNNNSRDDLFYQFNFSTDTWIPYTRQTLIEYPGTYQGDYVLDVISPVGIPKGHYKVDAAVKRDGEPVFLKAWSIHIQ